MRPPAAERGRAQRGGRKIDNGPVETSLIALQELALSNRPSTWDLFVASFARALEEISGTVHLPELVSCEPTIHKVDDVALPGPEPPRWISLEDASSVAKATAEELEVKTRQLEVGTDPRRSSPSDRSRAGASA